MTKQLSVNWNIKCDALFRKVENRHQEEQDIDKVEQALDGKLTNANKEKLLNFLDQQRTDYADVASVLSDEQVKQGNSEVSVATNIIENFETRTLQSGEIYSSNDDVRFRNIEEVNRRFKI